MRLLENSPIKSDTLETLNKVGITMSHGKYLQGKGIIKIPDNIRLIQYSIPGRILHVFEARYILQALLLRNQPLDLQSLLYEFKSNLYLSGIKPFMYEPGDYIYNLSLNYDKNEIKGNVKSFIGHYETNVTATAASTTTGLLKIFDIYTDFGQDNVNTDLSSCIDYYSDYARNNSIPLYDVIQISCKECLFDENFIPYIETCNIVNLNFDSKYFIYNNSSEKLFKQLPKLAQDKVLDYYNKHIKVKIEDGTDISTDLYNDYSIMIPDNYNNIMIGGKHSKTKRCKKKYLKKSKQTRKIRNKK